MAKEMMIVFIYDTSRCRKEEDDPADAVMYFHPAWVSPTQRLALAGQLMGINHFLSSAFSPPNLISLQGGKFVLKKFGQYILAVGTDRNIQDWILERRANTLESILQFFHCDLETISSLFNNDRNKFTEKLYQMLETYLPILQYSANLFSNIPMIKLPKGASNVFLEAMQVLQYCQETSGIMGGALFYNNKVVATQLNPELTKQLVITDPYRIKAPAERIPTSFHLPVGVQLLRVYVHRRQSLDLPVDSIGSSSKVNPPSYVVGSDGPGRKSAYKKIIASSGMKRDTSRIFTVPEEGESGETTLSSNNEQEESRRPVLPVRPISFSTTRKITEHKNDRPKYVNPPLTPSVCSTPLKDVNRVLHGTAVSICSANEEVENNRAKEKRVEEEIVTENLDEIPDVVKEALRCKRLNKLRNSSAIIHEKIVNKKTQQNGAWGGKSSSLSDLDEIRQVLDDRLAIGVSVPSHCGLGKMNYNEDSPETVNKSKLGKNRFTTITDPCYPVFRNDGTPVSRSLYDHYISYHYQELVKEQSTTIGSRSQKLTHGDSSTAFDFNVSRMSNVPKSAHQNLEGVAELAKSPESTSSTTNTANSELDVRLENKSRQENYRRSMSLPLKSLNAPATENEHENDRRKSTSECALALDFTQQKKKKLEGLQLTPLMSKLSLLADERTSGFCSRETTPSEFYDLSTVSSRLTRNKSESTARTVGGRSAADEDSALEDDLFWLSGESNSKDPAGFGLEKTELFICGHHNMVLFLLMEDGTGNNPDLIHNLWETCINTLGRLENRLQQCLDPLPSNENKELYSVLSVDPQWDTLHRSGLWGVTELDIVSSLHNRFTKTRNLTDIIVRTEDMVVYGSQCGKSQVFYQQAMAPNVSGGLPTPADLMGVVPLKAKRRLERDHGIIIL
ncbi:uncharacterized protein HPS4 isoform X2 [Venturia canescens]|uniref:uncharacterized protein HPS4 isoform X2 n=1 Tax=Venturia canescens TaxID=32260 RepID=UPI001C9D0FD8|nr:uncharacterized protein LOC122414417 isoform X2 [Venturia canescens]